MTHWLPALTLCWGLILPPQVLPQNTNVPKLTLRQCEELALKNSASVKDAQARLELAEAKRAQAAHAKILPKFEVRNVWGPSPRARGEFNQFGVLSSPDTSTGFSDLRYFTEVEVNLLQPIFTFGKFAGLSRAASYGAEAEEANFRKKQNDVRSKVRQVYWGAVLGKELLAVVENARSEMDKAESKIQEKLDEGSEDVSQTDLFKLKIFKYEINKRYREALSKIEIANAALGALIGHRHDEKFEIAAEYLDPVNLNVEDIDVYYDMAAHSRPEISQLRAGVNARESLLTVSRSDYYPQFFFGGQVKYNFAKDRFDPNNPFVNNPTNFFRPGFVVGASWNLNFLQTRDKVRVAHAEYKKLEEKEAVLSDAIKLEVRKTYLELKDAETNMLESRKALKASGSWLRSVSMTFDIGVAEVKDLIEAFQADGKMQAEHLENVFKYNAAAAKLSKVVGHDLYPPQ